MLVLSRKLGERLFIADQKVVVKILAVNGDRVRLGITAPPQVGIHREEVWLRLQEGTVANAVIDTR